MSGIMSVTGWPGGEPTRTGGPISDTFAGISLALGVLAALNYSRQTGIGQKVDIALVDSIVASMQIINQIYLATGRLPERIGNRYESTYPYDTFRTKDGESIVIGIANNKFWSILCNLMGKDELIEHPDMATNAKRVASHALIKPIVEAWTLENNSSDLVDMLLKNDVPAAPIYNIAQVASDPHIAGAREMFIEEEHPRIGKLKVTNSHIKMTETMPCFRTPPPDLGQHNDEVYTELLGYTAAEVEELKKEGII
jgi:formyl-CoA transferase